MANVTTKRNNRTLNVNPLTIPTLNPLKVLFHQIEGLYFTVGQMLTTMNNSGEIGETPGITPSITSTSNVGWPQSVTFGSNVVTHRTGRKRRTLTPAARRKIAAYQKKRWAGIKRGRITSPRKVTKMPPARVAA